MTSEQKIIEDKAAFLYEMNRKLKESEDNLAEVQRISHIGNWSWNITENKIMWSDELYRIFGLTPQDFRANYESYLKCLHPDDVENFKKLTDRVFDEKKPYSTEYRILRPNGDVRFIHERGNVTIDKNNNPIMLTGTIHDITDRKQLEWQVKNNLLEKKILLNEIHHRVKNNLQVVSSLINLQAMKLKGSVDSAPFIDIFNRIKSMAIAHEIMYHSDNFQKIDIGKYIKFLFFEMSQSNFQKHCKIENIIHSCDITLDLEKTMAWTFLKMQ